MDGETLLSIKFTRRLGEVAGEKVIEFELARETTLFGAITANVVMSEKDVAEAGSEMANANAFRMLTKAVSDEDVARMTDTLG